MDSRGRVELSKSREMYIQSRMIQVFGLSHIIGIANFERVTEHGIKVLNSQFLDKANGGFFNSIDLLGNPVRQEKLAYDHMFVLLAATTANVVGIPGAGDLVKKSESIIKRFFWDSDFEMMNDSWDLNFTKLDEYRGINSNMHAVEALSAAFDATGILLYRDWA